tara:strand:+ start:186 stop:446 length:261 start_codon:yes stop_codon:yes gene_type:complete
MLSEGLSLINSTTQDIMKNITSLLHQGVSLAKTPAQRAKVEFYVDAFAKRLARCNALLDEIDAIGLAKQNESMRKAIARTDKLLGH